MEGVEGLHLGGLVERPALRVDLLAAAGRDPSAAGAGTSAFGATASMRTSAGSRS